MSSTVNPTTMEGMIYNANEVLEKALSPNVNGIPKGLFKDLAGIAIVTSVQLGFLFSGNVGSGIVFKKKEDGWSPPLAVGLSGIGFGLLVGASCRELIFFIYDDITLESITKEHGAKMGANLELTLGPFGRSANTANVASKGGLGSVFAIAYSKGAFAGLSVDGGHLGTRDYTNNRFYSAVVNPHDVLFTPGAVHPPTYVGEKTVLDDVYEKLDQLAAGGVSTEGTDATKKQAAQDLANEKHEEIKDHPELVQVDAAAEAAKEG